MRCSRASRGSDKDSYEKWKLCWTPRHRRVQARALSSDDPGIWIIYGGEEM